MAKDDIAPPDDSDTFVASDTGGGSTSTWLSDHKYAVAGGGLVLLLAAFFIIKKKGSSSSSGSLGTSTGPAVYEVAPGYLTGGQGAFGSSIGTDMGIAGNTAPPPTPPPSPSPPATGPQYTYVSSGAQSKVWQSLGATQYGLLNGQYIPVEIGAKPTAAFAPYEAANNNAGALYVKNG